MNPLCSCPNQKESFEYGIYHLKVEATLNLENYSIYFPYIFELSKSCNSYPKFLIIFHQS